MCDEKILRSIHLKKKVLGWQQLSVLHFFVKFNCWMKLLFLWAHTQFKKKRKYTDSFGEKKKKIKRRTLLTMLILIFKEQHCITYTPKKLRYCEILHLTEAERGFFRRSQLLKRTFGIFGTEYGKCSETICRWCFYIHGHHTLSLEHF